MRKKKMIMSKVIFTFFLLFIVIASITTYTKTYSEYTTATTLKEVTDASGIFDNEVIVDENDSDYNYYMGLNYTESYDGVLPDGSNQNLYQEGNLLKTVVHYIGHGIDSDITGYVSLSERQDTYTYYKYYPIVDGKIKIKLIDNPFTDMPLNMGFNGWVTDNQKAYISYDSSYYNRYATVDVTDMTSLEINFYASWYRANVNYVGSNWANTISNFDEAGMKMIGGIINQYEDVSDLYISGSISGGWNSTYPSGAVNASGNSLAGNRCWWGNNCTYYIKSGSSKYNSNLVYYKLNNRRMEEYEVKIIGTYEEEKLAKNTSLAGFYRKVSLSYGTSLVSYYDSLGNYMDHGTCSDYNGCFYYELMQYYDSDFKPLVADGETIYYYLVTREMNIAVINQNINGGFPDNTSKPFLITSVYNSVDYRNVSVWNLLNGYVFCNSDIEVSNVKINSGYSSSVDNPASTSNQNGNFYANYYNVRLGRGIIQGNSRYKNFGTVFGGGNESTSIGSSDNVKKFRLVVESGVYNIITQTNGAISTRNNKYIESQAVYGSDYDRVNKNNQLLDVYFDVAGSFGGNYYASATEKIAMDATVKSGSFGTYKTNGGNYDSEHTVGIYVGGRNDGTHYASRQIKVEGGWIYNLIGGPLTASNRGNINDTYIFMTGGEVDMIVGGAGTTTTYGNRILSITGGKVNYSVFGGSNGYDGYNGDGKLTGSSFVYIGGNAVIGDENNVNNASKLWDAEAGSVFGIGNGKNGIDTIGTNDNSSIIIDGSATILGNVYGGGNFGATGISSTSSSNKTDIFLYGGVVKGNVYGAGNNNGAGDSSKNFSVNITLDGGVVEGSIYGGSRKKGTVFGDVSLKMLKGVVKASVYGGGEGGYQSSSESGTFVTGNISLEAGRENTDNSQLVVQHSIYGGSAFGTVNGSTSSSSVSSSSTNVKVLSGTIENVFGGGEGNSDYLPYVLGNTSVDIYGGKINNVYGGNDLKGTPNGNVVLSIYGGEVINAYAGGNKTEVRVPKLYLYGGKITNAYGGGNQAGVEESDVSLDGAIVQNLFGASNTSGDVSVSNVDIISGKAENVYGGNNIGGTTNKTNVNLLGGEVQIAYGGGKETDVNGSTNVNLKSSVGTIFGGSDTKGEVVTSYIHVNDGIADTIYGGNNLGGSTQNSNVSIHGGIISNVYGGGFEAETGNANINVIYGCIDFLFGGGKSAKVHNTYLNLNKGYIKNTYGGSNVLGDVDEVNIKNISQDLESSSGLYADVSFEESNVNQTGKSDILSSEKLKVVIHNESTRSYSNWDFYLITTDAVFDSNWSSTKVEEIHGVFHANQENQWYGTNRLSSGATHSFEFNIHSYVSYEDFKVIGYMIVGKNATGGTDARTVYYDNLYVQNLYGGNNEGGEAKNTNIHLTSGEYGTIYGGGRKANSNKSDVSLSNVLVLKSVYGGGDQAAIYDGTNLAILDKSSILGDVYGGGNASLVSGDVSLSLKNSSVAGNIYGGGNNGAVLGSTNTFVTSTSIDGSVHAGGNGKTAVVLESSKIDVDGSTVIKKHLFGGGNAAATGCEKDISTSEVISCSKVNQAKSYVNIAGATILGNVYGGANTSVVYGETFVNIGIDTLENPSNYVKGDILIEGTVFGGGEANASGSQDYDFKFISVTKGINIHLDAYGYDKYVINGSIFGSGNASSSGGYSSIDIDHYGTASDYKSNISIQRADVVTLNASAIELLGSTDRTNKYKNELFTFSRIKHLKLKNGSVLYLNKGTNLLEKLSSLVDVDSREEKVSVKINEDDKTSTKNGENYIYMLEGKNLNISDDESLATYGEVSGMTFFGMFSKDRTGKITTAMYSPTYKTGDKVSPSALYYFSSGSYVMGQHMEKHNYYQDGFYTNYVSSDGESIYQDYIEPTPNDTVYYRWVVGEAVEVIELSLTASKYSTLGTYELQLLNYYQPNTEFHVLGVNFSNLSSDIELLSSDNVPRYANSILDANQNFGLSMKTGTNGWITKGNTEFITDGENNFSGTTAYKSENSMTIPSFVFYLYHSKNLSISKDFGYVTISLMVSTPIDELNSKIQRVNIQVNISSALYEGDNYEGAITPGSQYQMFANSNVHITSKSTFSTYFSLFKESDVSIYKSGYYRSLVSNYALPVNTKITMIDLASSDKPEYYYYVINEEDYQNSLIELKSEGEISYPFSRFIRMGSPSVHNTYDDASSMEKYYDKEKKKAEEEFIFNVDLKDANIDETVLKKNLLMELRDSNDNPVIPVLDIAQQKMMYNLYNSMEAVIDASADLSSDVLYVGTKTDLNVTTNFLQKKVGSISIIDTNFYDQKLGIKLSLYDSEDNLVNGATLLGTKFVYEGVNYFPRQDGTVRFNIAESVANVASKITIDATNSNIPSGDYYLKIETFGSADGIYYGLTPSTTISKKISIINEIFGLSVSITSNGSIVDALNGVTESKNNYLDFQLEYSSKLKNPRIHISLFRRTYRDVYQYDYQSVDLADYVANELTKTDISGEYLVTRSPSNRFQYILNLKPNLKSGTYQVKFRLYDKNTYVGEVVRYVIFK